MPKPNLKPCPNRECKKSMPTQYKKWEGTPGGPDLDDIYEVYCDTCLCGGPQALTQKEADRLWNEAMPRHEVFDAGEVKPPEMQWVDVASANHPYWRTARYNPSHVGSKLDWSEGAAIIWEGPRGHWFGGIAHWKYQLPMPPAPGKEK